MGDWVAVSAAHESIVPGVAGALPVGARLRILDVNTALADQLQDAHVLLPGPLRVTAHDLACAPRLRLIQMWGLGTDGVDLVAAHARGVSVCNAPAINDVATAEMTFLLLLMAARRAYEVAAVVAARRKNSPVGIELQGKTLCVIGLGHVGREVAVRAAAFGMRVVGVSRAPLAALPPGVAVCRPVAALGEALAEADVISVHVPLTAETRGLLGTRELAATKPGAILVNTARAAVVERAALVRALEEGRLSCAALDVMWDEPMDPTDPLLALPGVIATPHMGGFTRESVQRLSALVAHNIKALVDSSPLAHVVTRPVS